MTMTKISPMIAGALFSLCLATVPARALPDHTYVSGKGADTGGCATPATACRTFAFAIAQTAAGGTIIAIDPANYGQVTIKKSISIVADGGGPAGIFLPTSNGNAVAISVFAGANDFVNLRGLTLDGAGTATAGIQVNSAGFVTIADCVVRRFNDGIILESGLQFLISNTVSSDHLLLNNQGGLGLAIIAGVGPIKGIVDRFTAANDPTGVIISTAGAGFDVSILNSVMANNGTVGLDVGGPNGTARLAGSVVTGNGTGIKIFGGSTVFSYGDNEINGNTTDVTGTLTPQAKR